MKTGVFKKVGYFAAAFALAASGSIFVPGADVSATKEGAVIDKSGDVVKVEMYLDAGESAAFKSVGDIGVVEPDDIDTVEKIPDGSGIVRYDTNQDGECLVGGNAEGRVGQGMITCKYWKDEVVVLTVEVAVHTYMNPDGGDLDMRMVAGTTLNLIDVVGDYFDDPTKITIGTDVDEEECEDGDKYCGPAFALTGTTVADATVTANSNITSGTIYFYGPYSTDDALASLFVQVFEKPELEDVTLVAYGAEEDKSVPFVIEEDGNLPFYTLTSSDEGIVKVEENEDGEYKLVAQGVGEATITVTYETYAKPTQTFKVTVNEIAEDGMYTELETKAINESTLDDVVVANFGAAKRATGDVILGYYNVDLLAKNSTTRETVEHITEAGSARKVVLPYPAEMPAVADGYTRVYYVIRDHNDEKDILPAYDNGDGENFYFYSDKFSTFALAYYDVETAVAETVTSAGATLTSATINPNTLDNGVSYMVMAGVAAVTMAGAIVYLVKREA